MDNCTDIGLAFLRQAVCALLPGNPETEWHQRCVGQRANTAGFVTTSNQSFPVAHARSSASERRS